MMGAVLFTHPSFPHFDFDLAVGFDFNTVTVASMILAVSGIVFSSSV